MGEGNTDIPLLIVVDPVEFKEILFDFQGGAPAPDIIDDAIDVSSLGGTLRLKLGIELQL